MGNLTNTLLAILLASGALCRCNSKYDSDAKADTKQYEAKTTSDETRIPELKEDLCPEPSLGIESLFGECQAEPKTNEEWILSVVDKDPNLSLLVKDGKLKLAGYLSDALKSLKHLTPEAYSSWMYRDIITWEKPTLDDLVKVEQLQLIQTHYLLQALSDPVFRKKIGAELEKDTKDYSCEHGGALHLISKSRVYVEMLADDSNNPNINFAGDDFKIGSHRNSPDQRYYPKKPEISWDILTLFHFHAQEADHSESAALSGNDFWNGGAVFTRVGEKKFNVDFALDYNKDNDNWQRVNLDLGVYEY